MKPAELRRSYEELVDAYRLLEVENAKLRARLNPKPEPEETKLTPPPTRPPAPASDGPRVSQLVCYVDKAGHEHVALVLAVLPEGRVRAKVFRQAVADLVIELAHAKGPEQRNCWRSKK